MFLKQFGKFFTKLILIIIICISFYTIISIISFNPCDKSWLNSNKELIIHNITGKLGANIADTLFFIFGIPAYFVPSMILFFCFKILNDKKVNYLTLSIKFISFIILLLTSCCLISFFIEDLYYFSSGGLIGLLLKNKILLYCDKNINIILLLVLWIIGFNFFLKN